jgi:hypothetical protein
MFDEHAVLEDPVGSSARRGHEEIREFFARAARTPLRLSRIGPVCVVSARALFQFRVDFGVPGVPSMTSADVCEVSDRGLFLSLTAYPDPAADPDGDIA